MYVASVGEFIQPTPVCAQAAGLQAVLKLFRQTSCERVIVANGQRLIGTLSLHRLTNFLLEETMAEATDGDRPETAIASWQQSLQESSLLVDQPLYEPLIELSANLPIDQLAPYLQDLEQRQYALVDASGTCLGLLNQTQLLKFLVLNPIPALQERSPEIAEVQDRLEQPGEKAIAFEYTRRSPSVEPTFREPITESISANLLIDLLEQLPLPMMLQTSTGEVVARNLSWREQLGELQDPSTVGREAALLLKAATPVLQSSQPAGSLLAGSAFEAPSFANSTHGSPLPEPWKVANQMDSSGDRLSFCHLGPDLDTCVCTCPMKNGQERTWQFLKIPLGDRSTQAQFSMAALLSVVESRRRAQSASQFDPDLIAPGHSSQTNHSQELWLVLAQDTTEQHRVAKELTAKNADLVQLNRLKDEFLACIGHELKTPLTAVLGLSTLLKDQALGELNNRQTRYAQLIHQSGRHLVLIVNDILDLTRIETGQLELTLEPVNIKTVCDRAYEQACRLQPQEESPGTEILSTSELEIHFALTVQLGLETLIADELRLRQMLTNLLSNAFKFTEVDGKVGLTVETWESWIAFTVWDTGIGIPDEKQHLIFQKFQQLENPLTRRYEGTGLGLVLTQRLARLHGGDVTFTSVEGKGSQFTILLPPSPPQANADQSPQSIKPLAQTYSNRLVLVVETVPRFLEDLTHQLAGLGYRVAIARSGTEALEKVRRLQPTTVFLNPALPLLSGWDVLILLKSDAETRHIPIIVTASHLEKTQAYRNGADGFLSLPIQPNDLEQSLEPFTQLVTEPQNTGSSLTILHLSTGGQHLSSQSEHYLAAHLNSLLHPLNCRMLEVDDLDQADLLAKVWKPNVMLLDGDISDPMTYLKQLSKYSALAALPLVTLTAEITQAANQLPELTVFPCLASLPSPGEAIAHSDSDSALLQVIQVAAGMSWAPHVLVVDVAALQQDWVTFPEAEWAEGKTSNLNAKRTAEWLQASMQYFQAAGYRSSISRSWSEVLEQIQHQSVDLLLLCVRHADPHPSVLKALQTLAQVGTKPPILVWNCQPQPLEVGATLGEVLEAIAAQVLPSSLSMKELLEQINQTLVRR